MGHGPAELNLLSATATPILNRVVPILAGILALFMVSKLFRRHPKDTVDTDTTAEDDD